jgi:hypothetical protein
MILSFKSCEFRNPTDKFTFTIDGAVNNEDNYSLRRRRWMGSMIGD